MSPLADVHPVQNLERDLGAETADTPLQKISELRVTETKRRLTQIV